MRYRVGMYSDKLVDRIGEQGVYLLAWGFFCLTQALALNERSPWPAGQGVFLTELPLIARILLWGVAGLVATICAFVPKTGWKAVAFGVLGLTLAQRAAGYFSGFVSWMIPGDPQGAPDSIWWFFTYASLLWILWLNARWSPLIEEREEV